MHITVRLQKDLPTLRSKKAFVIFRKAVLGAKQYGLDVIEFAVLGNHFHLLVESSSNAILHSAMKSLNIRIARAFNFKLNRTGPVVHDRYDLQVLKTPTEVRNALIYIFANAAKHFKKHKVFDWYNSFGTFDRVPLLAKWRKDLDWRVPDIVFTFQDEYAELLSESRSWLARVGWERAQGPLRV